MPDPNRAVRKMKSNEKRDFMQRKIRRIHFVGIGGIGMSGIAEVLLNLGYSISGSDISRSETTQRLESLGINVLYGHEPSNLGDADVVVTSTAIHEGNQEVIEAGKRNIPVIPRAEMLAELLKMKFSVAVSGSHGKTTTTSMIATILADGGLDPTMVIGGKLAGVGSNAKLGDGEIIVAEADESDGSFLTLSPTIAVITNIDREHLDFYSGIEDIKEAFLQFANRVPFYGSTILCSDDPHVREILPEIKRATITYGLSGTSDYRAADVSSGGLASQYKLYRRGDYMGDISIGAPGLFNVYNSLAAVAVALELDMDFSTIQRGVKTFTGVQRRLEVKGVRGGVTVIDDYGHHPTEIRATLEAARKAWTGRMIVVFQPHRYTRTRELFDDFLDVFDVADYTILTDIYAASEKEIEGIHSAHLCDGIRGRGNDTVTHISSFDVIVDHLNAFAQPGDFIITLGAGNIWQVGEAFLALGHPGADSPRDT
jgi:UDP-N-acetylmuramate--alanine ligase